MRGTLILIGVAAVAIGAGVYFYMPAEFFNSASSVAYTPPVNTGTPASANNAPAQTSTVTFRILDTGTRATGVSVRKNYAASAEADFAKLWKMAHGTDGAALPKIDFSKEYVIGVFAGQKSTGGNSIAVTAITDTGDTRTFAVTLTSPGTGCSATQSLTSPYQIVAVALSSASLAHSDTEVSQSCN